MPSIRDEVLRESFTPYPFEPGGAGVNVQATTANTTVALAGQGPQLSLTNYGSVPVFVQLGSAGVTASIASLCLLAGSGLTLTIPDDATHLAVVTETGSGKLQASRGWGV